MPILLRHVFFLLVVRAYPKWGKGDRHLFAVLAIDRASNGAQTDPRRAKVDRVWAAGPPGAIGKQDFPVGRRGNLAQTELSRLDAGVLVPAIRGSFNDRIVDNSFAIVRVVNHVPVL